MPSVEYKLKDNDSTSYETDGYFYEVEIYEGQFVLHVFNKKTKRYVFDETFDETAERFF